MYYQDLSNNMIYVLRTARVLTRKQILRFFEQEYGPGMINWVIRVLTAYHKIDHNVFSDRLAYHTSASTPEINEDEKRKRIRAFWVIAEVGSGHVNQIFSLSYGSQFFFDSGNDCYELTVVDTLHDANISLKDRDLHLERSIPDFQDSVVRIAIVPDEDLADRISDYGFDAYCTLDGDNRPVFGSWNREEGQEDSCQGQTVQ